MIDVVLPKIECVARAENYGRFVIEPLESGYGITLGNALRRILLSSLPGAAVTAIRMDGVYHEFSTIPHVKEDTTEIILNVKQIRLRCFADHPVRLYISAEGEGEITAGDIECPSEVEIINKGLHLLTLDSPEAQIDMELTVERGKGYVPAEQREGLPIGTIPVDAIFSPVRKVNFFTEHTRIGQVTTFDRLTLEIWVDGSTQPDEALSRAAGILVKHFSLIAELGKTVALSEKRPLSPIAIPVRLYETPIEELDLSVRAYNCLKRSGISKVGQILEMNEADLLAVRNFGRKSLEELMERLALRGFLPTSPAQAEAALRGENNEEVPVTEQGEGDSAQ
ncbi:MAG: DNA-directed RNA polymerase subunit alpha [Chloroflexota bacterium]